jgi:GlpG protein
MRQVGTNSKERDAQRFAAWLTTQQIEAHAEQEQDAWAIWVRDEDHLAKARAALADFQANPQDTKYQDAERSAAAVVKTEETRRRQAQKNVVEMRGRWGGASPVGGGVSRRCPLVLATIGVTILVAIATYDDTINSGGGRSADQPPGVIYRNLTFIDLWADRGDDFELTIWSDVARGQVWRLITPIFIHYGLAHIILNLLWLHSFGGQIEDRRGSAFMAALILALAISSNFGQAVEADLRSQGALFGGMSGVGYGLFGYLLVKVKFDNRGNYFLHPATTFIALLWFVLCIAREVPPFASVLQGSIPPIANSAHAVGLAVGAALAYAPLLIRKPA